MKRVFFDTETTGLSPGQIAQLSVIIDEDGKEITGKNFFFEVKYISDGAKEVCGRDVDFYKEASNGKLFADCKEDIIDIFTDATFIAHNLKFDENFLSTELWRVNAVVAPKERFDTMTYFKDICKLPGRNTKYKNPKLEELVDHFKIDKEKVKKYSEKLFGSAESDIGFHDARYDTTSMFVAFQIYKDSLNGGTEWASTFCID